MKEIKVITKDLYNNLKNYIEKSDQIFLLVSFIMNSGVDKILQLLKNAVERGVDIKILTGDYLYVTEPIAIEKLYNLGDGVEIRLFQSQSSGRSFHPKVYAFENEAESSVVIGSSNLSASGITSGIEWNIAIEDEAENNVYIKVIKEFMNLFYSEFTISINSLSLNRYKLLYDEHKSDDNFRIDNIFKQSEAFLLKIDESDEDVENNFEEKEFDQILDENIKPHEIQQEALFELKNTIEEGYEAALVVMATGLGKTYLSAFFSNQFKKILFIAHRREILSQAQKTFFTVFPDRSNGILDGYDKDSDVDILFASVQTLSLKKNLLKFDQKIFDLIIVDEFHHAAANSYQKIIDYFEPQFLMGLTATPDRMDGKDIYGLCDGNLAYQIDLFEAINRNFLVPFEYFGVYDNLDYSKIKSNLKRYNKDDLFLKFKENGNADKILEKWLLYKKTRTIGFCSSVKQADFMNDYFNEKGFKSMSLTGGSSRGIRRTAIEKLKNLEIEIIFTVDLFNEGVDIPAVDTLLFIRPTESLTVFIQQLGRGLRLSEEKDFCRIIDFAGNYFNVDIKFELFGINEANIGNEKKYNLPENCSIEFEIDIINLYKELMRIKKPRKQLIFEAYEDLKLELGRRPTYLEMSLLGKEDAKIIKQEWKSYLGFLLYYNELSFDEESFFIENKDFIELIEKTSMTRSYKMVLIQSILEMGSERWFKPTSSYECAPNFQNFYLSKPYRGKDVPANLDIKNEKSVAKRIKEMPMDKISGSSKGLIKYDKINDIFVLYPKIKVRSKESDFLYDWLWEITDYRVHSHFERRYGS